MSVSTAELANRLQVDQVTIGRHATRLFGSQGSGRYHRLSRPEARVLTALQMIQLHVNERRRQAAFETAWDAIEGSAHRYLLLSVNQGIISASTHETWVDAGQSWLSVGGHGAAWVIDLEPGL